MNSLAVSTGFDFWAKRDTYSPFTKNLWHVNRSFIFQFMIDNLNSRINYLLHCLMEMSYE